MLTIQPGGFGQVGSWWYEGSVKFQCPACGGVSDLSMTYRIGDDGLVSPEFECPCGGFHAYIKIVHYNPHDHEQHQPHV